MDIPDKKTLIEIAQELDEMFRNEVANDSIIIEGLNLLIEQTKGDYKKDRAKEIIDIIKTKNMEIKKVLHVTDN